MSLNWRSSPRAPFSTAIRLGLAALRPPRLWAVAGHRTLEEVRASLYPDLKPGSKRDEGGSPEARLALIEGILMSLTGRPRVGAVRGALALLEGVRVPLEVGGRFAEKADVAAVRTALEAEARKLREADGLAAAAQARAANAAAAKPGKPKSRDPKRDAGSAQAKAEFERQHPRAQKGRAGAGKWVIKRGEGYGEDGPQPVVRQLQERLTELGYRAETDGRFGAWTEKSVKSFQRTYGLEPTGQIDQDTVETLRNPPPKKRAEAEAEIEQESGSEKGKSAATAAAAAPGKSDAKIRGTAAVNRENEQARQDAADAAAKKGGSGKSSGGSKASKAKGGAKLSAGKAKKGKESRLAKAAMLAKGAGMGEKADPAVKQLQEIFDALGISLGEQGADGRFGPETQRAVKQLQRKYGLKPDGIVGPQTKALLSRLEKRNAASKRKADQRDAAAAPKAEASKVQEAAARDPRLLLAEARAERKAAAEAGDSVTFTRARARERTLAKMIEEGLPYDERLHPRNRIGRWAEVLGGGRTRFNGGRPVRDAALPPGVVLDGDVLRTLPEDPTGYFNLGPGIEEEYGGRIVNVPLAKIQTIRARPGGIERGGKAMANEHAGKGAKRDPIILIPDGEGGYTVHDGNSTVNIAQGAGWEKIPALVAADEGDARRMEAVLKAKKARGAGGADTHAK